MVVAKLLRAMFGALQIQQPLHIAGAYPGHGSAHFFFSRTMPGRPLWPLELCRQVYIGEPPAILEGSRTVTQTHTQLPAVTQSHTDPHPHVHRVRCSHTCNDTTKQSQIRAHTHRQSHLARPRKTDTRTRTHRVTHTHRRTHSRAHTHSHTCTVTCMDAHSHTHTHTYRLKPEHTHTHRDIRTQRYEERNDTCTAQARAIETMQTENTTTQATDVAEAGTPTYTITRAT